MCTLVILRRPEHPWPVLLAANRDEMAGRPWKPPGRHWPDRPEVTAGLDELAGGSWLGVNDHGLVAGVLNRMGSLGPDPDKRSRGELVLEALDHADADEAAAALADLDARAYRPFNLVVADNRDAFWIRAIGAEGGGRPKCLPIPEGLHMVTAHDMDDEGSARIRRHRPRFAAGPIPDPGLGPDPEDGDWAAWEGILASRGGSGSGRREDAMNVVTDFGFGTVSSSLIALPGPLAAPSQGAAPVGTTPEADTGDAPRVVFRFAAGRPGEAKYENIPT